MFGIPDERYGEIVCAWIKLRAGEHCDAEAVRTFCRERIAHYKVPAQIRFAPIFRPGSIKTEAGRKKKIADMVAMLKRGETFHPQKAK